MTTLLGSSRGVGYRPAIGLDASGNIYFAPYVLTVISRLTPAGAVEPFATTSGEAGAPGAPGVLGAVLAFSPGGDLAVADSLGLWRINASRQVTRYAGGGSKPDGSQVDIDGPLGVGTVEGVRAMAFDTAGTLYLAQSNHVIRRVSADGTVVTIAGAHGTSGTADGTGTSARFNVPGGIAVDASGVLFVADSGNHSIRRVTPEGVVTTIAGTPGTPGFANGAAETALFRRPAGIAVTATGDLFVSDTDNQVIRKVAGGVVSTFVGLPATSSLAGASVDIAQPRGLLIDAVGSMTLTDATMHTLWQFSPSTSTASMIAGKAAVPGSADGVAAATATFTSPSDVAVDAAGNIYIAQWNAIRRVATDGTVTTFAGNLNTPGSDDGTGPAARFGRIKSIVKDAAGNFYVGDPCAIRKVTPSAVVTTLAGQGAVCGFADGVGASARFQDIADLAIGPDGTIYVAGNNVLRAVSPAGVVTTVAGRAGFASAADGTGQAAGFLLMNAVAVDSGGTIYVGDEYAIRKVTPAGVVTTLAGIRTFSPTPVDGTGQEARFRIIGGLEIAADGTLYAIDTLTVRTVTPAGVVTTVAGGSLPGVADGAGRAAAFMAARHSFMDSSGTIYLIDGDLSVERVRTFAAATQAVSTLFSLRGAAFGAPSVDGAAYPVATFNAPSGIARATDGTILVADTGNHTIRRVANNIVTTVAGTPGTSGSVNGAGAAARFNAPQGIALDSAGNLYVADTANNAIRKVTPAGVVSTVVTGLTAPKGVAVDGGGNIYVADSASHTVKVVSSSGVVSILAGLAGEAGSADGTGSNARFSSPSAVAIGPGGVIYVADTGNHTLRAVTPAGVVTTIAGSPGIQGLTDGTGAAARLNAPEALAVDAGGALFFGDTGNGAIRLALIGGSAPIITSNPQGQGVAIDGTAQFSCAASGTPAPSYRWELLRPGATTPESPLSDDMQFSGVSTPTLTIANVRAGQQGERYRCRALNVVGSALSNTATLTVFSFTLSPVRGVAFGATGSAGALTAVTPAQTVFVTWNGTDAPAWTVTADKSWIHITNGSGAGTGTFVVSATEPPGSTVTESGLLTLTSPAGAALTVQLPVIFRRLTTAPAPFGAFDTPVNNATGVQGSIAVTGWALDDVQMDRVEIWRDPLSGETAGVFNGSGPGNGKIFIGNAVFVTGARPDVETLYSFLKPATTTAGWGYMLLTYGLFNQGNGAYKLYAFAFNKAGAFSTLGTKTISVDNAHATKPFGAIDTPGQGATASGIMQNFGWALTPGSSCSIANPNVQVSIDSGPLQTVVYGDARSDIAAGFPGYTNAAAAGGHYTLDTTTLANGVHTIGWLVTDNCGRVDGVGSRFFTVANSSVITAPSVAGRSFGSAESPALKSRPTSAGVGRDFSPGETRVVRVGQNERVEVPLPGDEPYVAAPLPIGASFDAATNTFMWQPAAGFLGAYDLSFAAGSRVEKLRVVVGPPIRMVIDTPHAGNVLASSGFTVAGWAVDLGSLSGGGIDTLHVWAYPVGGGDPVFVGVAKSRGARPDVARLYGATFDNAGFTLTGTLAPGTYDLVVYAHSAATSSFAGAETIRIIVR